MKYNIIKNEKLIEIFSQLKKINDIDKIYYIEKNKNIYSINVINEYDNVDKIEYSIIEVQLIGNKINDFFHFDTIGELEYFLNN